MRKWLQQVMVGLNSDRRSSNSIPHCHAKQEGTHKTVRPFHWKVCIGVKKKKRRRRNISSGRLEGFISFVCLIKSCLVILLKDNLATENTRLLPEIMHQQILICTRLDPGFRKAKVWPKESHWFRIEELCLLSVLTLQDFPNFSLIKNISVCRLRCWMNVPGGVKHWAGKRRALCTAQQSPACPAAGNLVLFSSLATALASG